MCVDHILEKGHHILLKLVLAKAQVLVDPLVARQLEIFKGLQKQAVKKPVCNPLPSV